MSYLIDTNVISELLRAQPHKAVIEWFGEIPSESLYMSALTIGEIRKGLEMLAPSNKKSKLVRWVEEELPSWFEDRILVIDQAVAEKWGYILAKSEAKVPAIDSLLAATALVHNLKIVTRNTKDFNMFLELEVINPWE